MTMPTIKGRDITTVLYAYRYHFLFGMILIITAINLTIDIMEIDAAQYASISLHMAQTGSYLQVYQRDADYLDKPPLLFWLSSFSISIFGNTNFAYKLPSVLLLMVSLWATYSFSKLWYDHRTGLVATLMLATTQAFYLMTNDVRTDGLLTSFIILSVLCLSYYLKNGKIRHLFLGGFCIGGAMLAKGPIGIVIPAMAISGHLILSGQWKKIINPTWLLVGIPVAVCLAPMCYGLYTQFDLHPEKEVLGHYGTSGLMFYFWTQSFGRITGENPWHNNAPWYYFLQTMLWDLQPWVALFVPALFLKIKSYWKNKSGAEKKIEWITLSGFVLPLMALSASRYKLPHYVFPLFPFAAIIAADYLVRFADKLPRWFEMIQLSIIHFLFVFALVIILIVFPGHGYWILSLIFIFYILFWWIRKKSIDAVDRWLLPSLVGVILFQLIMSLHFYPELLKYQSASEAGKCVALDKPQHAYWDDKFGFAFDYYSGYTVPRVFGPSIDSIPAGSWIYVTADGLAGMPPYKIVHTFDDFGVSLLNIRFLNPETRYLKLKKAYLIELMAK